MTGVPEPAAEPWWKALEVCRCVDDDCPHSFDDVEEGDWPTDGCGSDW